MDNTLENAKKFYMDFVFADGIPYDSLINEKCMVAYCSACSATSSIGNQEIQKAAIECLEASTDLTETEEIFVLAGFYEGAKWLRSRLSNRKIVLPQYRAMRNIESTAWNKCIDEIKRLNGIN